MYFVLGSTTSSGRRKQLTVQPEIFARRKFLPISAPALIGEILSTNSFSCVKYYIADMATFTVLATILSLKNYCNTKIVELGKILSHENFDYTVYCL